MTVVLAAALVAVYLVSADEQPPQQAVPRGSTSRDLVDQPGEPDRHPAQQATTEAPAVRQYHVRLAEDQLLLVGEEGRPLVGLVPQLLVSYSPLRLSPSLTPAPEHPRRIPFELLQIETDTDGSWIARTTASIPGVDYHLTIAHTASAPGVAVRLDIMYRTDLLVHMELLRFRVLAAEGASMVDRSYRLVPVPLERRMLADPLSPHVVRTGRVGGQVTLMGGPGVQSMIARMTHDGELQVDLELDHQDNHPFAVFRDCNVTPSSSPPTLHLDEAWRRAGETRSGQADWVVGPMVPLTIGRLPRGYQAAVVFADHADMSDADKLEAFAFGRSGALAAGEIGPDYPGFVNRGLSYTKTVFIEHSPNGRSGGPQFDHDAYRRVLDRMAAAGVELGVHSPSPRRDKPHQALGMLRSFRQTYAGRVWIDHQPDTNCEAIANQGWSHLSPWFMLDNLASTGFDTVAFMDDMPLAKGSINLLDPTQPGARCPLVYRHSRLRTTHGADFRVFTSTWLYISRQRWARWFSPEALDRLEQERGVLIGHVYFDAYRPTGFRQVRDLIVPQPGGGYRLRPVADEVFQRLAGRQHGGTVWVTGVSSLADHMLPAMETRVVYREDGTVTLTGPPGRAIKGLTVRMVHSQQRMFVNNRPVTQRYTSDGLLEAWFDLPADRPVVLQLKDINGLRQPFAGPALLSLVQPEGDLRQPEGVGATGADRATW